jgi:hypothetical protein
MVSRTQAIGEGNEKEMSENDIEIHVEIVNLRYKLVGFTAIREFKEWLDEHASSCTNGNGGYAEACDAPDTPSTPLREPDAEAIRTAS